MHSTCIHRHIQGHTHTQIHTQANTETCASFGAVLRPSTHTFLKIHIYIQIHTHKHIYIHMHTWRGHCQTQWGHQLATEIVWGFDVIETLEDSKLLSLASERSSGHFKGHLVHFASAHIVLPPSLHGPFHLPCFHFWKGYFVPGTLPSILPISPCFILTVTQW